MEKILLPATMENFEKMIEFIRNGAAAAGFDSKMVNKINLACEEALVNVIKYAYSDKVGDVEITYKIIYGEKGMQIEIIDWGISFNPLSIEKPNIDAPIEERPIGGLGIYMVLNIMDKVNYRRDQDRNIFTMIKFLPE